MDMAVLIRETDPLPPSALSSPCDKVLDAVVLKAIAHDQNQRYQSVEALIDDLNRYLRGEVVQARTSTRFERWVRLLRRNPVAASFMIAVFLGLCGGLIHISQLAGTLMEETALESASMHSDMLERMNTLYSTAVAAPMRGSVCWTPMWTGARTPSAKAGS